MSRAGQDSHGVLADPEWQEFLTAVGDHRNLITFCDGFTIVPGESANLQHGSLEGWVGVSVEPVNYQEAGRRLNELLQAADVEEFQFVEIVNGRNAWASRTIEDRRRWVEVLCHHALRWIKRVDMLTLKSKDHERLSRVKSSVPPQRWGELPNAKHAIDIDFVNLLVRRLAIDHPGRMFVIVTDTRRRWKNVSRDVFEAGSSVCGGRVFNFPSFAVKGLQLADLCAYALNRAHRHRVRVERGTEAGPFDDLLVEFWEGLVDSGRIWDLRLDIQQGPEMDA